jgi:mannose-6-phosphate isomerase-like protein (cupin superfamily)
MRQGYVANIETVTLKNSDYRRVIYTAEYCQLVVMCLQPAEEIGEETHNLDQFIRFEQGTADVVLNKTDVHPVRADFAVIIPAGTCHNIINTGSEDLKLYTLYAPPEHKDGIVERTKADESEKHFDGVTTE